MNRRSFFTNLLGTAAGAAAAERMVPAAEGGKTAAKLMAQLDHAIEVVSRETPTHVVAPNGAPTPGGYLPATITVEIWPPSSEIPRFDIAATVDGKPAKVTKWTMTRWRQFNPVLGVVLHKDPNGRYATFDIEIDPPPAPGSRIEGFMVPMISEVQ